MRSLVVSALVLSALLISSTVGAKVASQPDPKLYMTEPVIIGTVVSSTDHLVIVDTDDGERMNFEYDSRSVVPPTIPPGSRVKIEFHIMDSGTYRAGRVTPLRGSSADASNGNLITYAGQEHVVPVQLASREEIEPAAYAASSEGETGSTDASTTESHEEQMAAQTETNEGENATPASDEENRELPRTASDQPLLVWLGLLALGTAASIWAMRRRSA